MVNQHLLNIGNALLHLYQFLIGIHIDWKLLSAEAQHWVENLQIFGIVASLTLAIIVTYLQIRILQMQEEQEGVVMRKVAAQRHHDMTDAKNPRWEAVLALASSPNESDWRRAILEADNMLSTALAERGFTGATMADQLRAVNPLQVTTLDLAWEAHRMRNALAHLGEAFPLSERDARATIDLYRRVFEELNYI